MSEIDYITLHFFVQIEKIFVQKVAVAIIENFLK